jgi:MYND finger
MARNVRNIRAMVEEFNSLPSAGSWSFGIEPIFVNAYYIFAFDNDTGFFNISGRIPILCVSDPVKEVNIIVRHLLELFLSSFNWLEFLHHGYHYRRVQPQTWTLISLLAPGPDNQAFAAAIVAELRAIGVGDNLCFLQTASLESHGVYYLSYWRRLTQHAVTLRSLETNARLHPYLPEPARGGPPPVFCANLNCENSITIFFRPLSLCGGCHKAWYCDNYCQGLDWSNRHKHVCNDQPWNMFGQSKAAMDEVEEGKQDMPPLIPVEDSDNWSEIASSEPYNEIDHEETWKIGYEKTESEKTKDEPGEANRWKLIKSPRTK